MLSVGRRLDDQLNGDLYEQLPACEPRQFRLDQRFYRKVRSNSASVGNLNHVNLNAFRSPFIALAESRPPPTAYKTPGSSDHDAFDLVERDRVRRPVVQLRRSR